MRGFRKGLYAGNVDFHVGDLSKFVEGELKRRGTGEPFLSYAVLDLPATEDHLETVAKALRDDAVLTVFCPSVTQIAECVEHVKRHDLPFFLEQVVELGANYSAGRPWAVRVVKPRVVQRIENEHIEATEAIEAEQSSQAEADPLERHESIVETVKKTVGRITGSVPVEEMNNWKTVCRPEIGGRITGGGFLGVWRRTNFKPKAPIGDLTDS